MRIGFLFNHDQVHQVAHILPVALALSRAGIDSEIVLAVTTQALADEVRRLGGGELAKGGIELKTLNIGHRLRKLAVKATCGLAPTAKLLVYGDNLDFFRSLDILVVAEKTSLMLKTRYKLDRLRIIHTRHGAGDRAIGFNRKSAGFDLILASGEKIKERLVRDANVAKERIRVVGYPKFDILSGDRPPFIHGNGDDRPIVLYNPHVSPHLSSWYKMGRAVLDWFVRHDEYRLIFAPHVMLFHRRFVLTIDKFRFDRVGLIDDRIRAASNIHVDLGSPACTDMTYTRAADIYLGDVSSQVYEFLERPRPCVFLDAHGVDWLNEPNFAHWAAGPVAREIGELGTALIDASQNHQARFAPVQRRLFARSFDLNDTPSSERAAQSIMDFASIAPGSR
ncbi:MAG TPA: hypothetical protein VGC28_01480 [Sphingomonas sp.]